MGMKKWREIWMVYEFWREKIVIASAPVPDINTDQSLNGT